MVIGPLVVGVWPFRVIVLYTWQAPNRVFPELLSRDREDGRATGGRLRNADLGLRIEEYEQSGCRW